MTPDNYTHRKIKRFLQKCHFQQSFIDTTSRLSQVEKSHFTWVQLVTFAIRQTKNPAKNQPIRALSHADISKNRSCHPQQKTNRFGSNIHQIKPLPYFSRAEIGCTCRKQKARSFGLPQMGAWNAQLVHLMSWITGRAQLPSRWYWTDDEGRTSSGEDIFIPSGRENPVLTGTGNFYTFSFCFCFTFQTGFYCAVPKNCITHPLYSVSPPQKKYGPSYDAPHLSLIRQFI